MKVRFSADRRFAIRTGKVFEAGDYPDKAFSLTEEEMEAAVAAFQPVDANIEHRPSLLDGALGGLRRVWRQGQELFGEIAIPTWLHEATAGDPIKPSLEWNRETKQICGIGYVLNPRITDAALMAAFSASEFGDKGRMQYYHDMACADGAECSGKPMFAGADTAAFMTPDELKAIQHIHDHAAKNGASCDAYATRRAMYFSDSEARPQARAGKGKMSRLQRLVAFLRGEGVIDEEEAAQINGAAVQPREVADFSQTAEFKAMKAEIEELKAGKAADAAAAQFTADSGEIAGLVREFKLTPAEADVWRGIAEKTPDAYAAAKPALFARSPIPALAGGGQDGQEARSGAEQASPDTDRLHNLALAHQKENGGTYSAAFSAVCRENPELAKAVAFSAPTVTTAE